MKTIKTLLFLILIFGFAPNINAQYELYYAIQSVKRQQDTGIFVGSVLNPNFLSKVNKFQSQYLIAITDVIIERAKEELAVAYFDKLTIKMETEVSINVNNSIEPIRFYLKDLFPETYLLLKNCRNNINPIVINVTKSTLENDFRNLPSNISKIRVPDSITNTEIFSAIELVREFYLEASGGKKVPEIFLNTQPNQNRLNTYTNNVFNIICCISNSLINKELVTPNWFDEDKISDLSSEVWNDYINRMMRNESFVHSISEVFGKDFQLNSKAFYDFIYNNVYTFLRSGYRLNMLTYKETESLSSYNAIPLITEFANLYQSYLGINNSDETNLNKVRLGIEQIINTLNAVQAKDYNTCLVSLINMLNILSDGEQVDTETMNSLLFMSQFASAKTTEDAKKVIESIILPVGSYKLKREADLSITLNSYIGLNAGGEFVKSDAITKANLGGYATPFLPIGVDLSRTWGVESGKGHSLSLFISAIDLGAVFSYRFKTNSDTVTISDVPEFKLNNVFSPGVFCIWGIRNSPISIGAGIQYAPSLREIKSDNGIVNQTATSLRFGAMLTVDIPLFNLSTGKKKSSK